MRMNVPYMMYEPNVHDVQHNCHSAALLACYKL
jgi:hypothetical protein